jgi:aspartyl-tRNA(Asn)/glutamyl-tRNA(Gln) amidotransferase subunit A
MDDKIFPLKTLTETAESIRSGKRSPVEIVTYYLSRIKALEGSLGAFRLTRPDQALLEASAAARQIAAGNHLGPLHGIPFAVKDLFDVQGLPTTAGTHLLENNIPTRDSRAVSALRKAGMILTGKTNTVQFAYSGVGINHDQGTPVNPWGTEPCIPGGSSSGSAVAVAAGMTPFALGTDTGGSVRIPAALCGVTGLKTTVGRISRSGVYPLSSTMDSVGVLCRFAEDAALVYQAMKGRDPGDEATLLQPAGDEPWKHQPGCRAMRMVVPEDVFWDDADPEVTGAVLEAVEIFKALGADVRPCRFPEAAEAVALNRNSLIIAAEAYCVNKTFIDDHFDELDPVVANRIVKGKDVKAADYLADTRAWRELRRSTAETLADAEVILVPTTPIPALPIQKVDADSETYSKWNVTYLRNTSVGNILDLCGLSIPCGFTSKGLPIGLMLYGRPFGENAVLRAGIAFQEATDWHLKLPPRFR